ncbi:TPA: hypothetical protein QH574_000831 [Enterobacter kobei]|uniref:Uncharacterized protein n=1 Tax=Enterobacter cloacae TaxID=550 RepID=A0A6S5K196_ENTCL|nr:hypothetical protein [Enterobacter cloacae]BBS33387.1 hypothetical protein WP5S18C02_35930 [Enterobacter cloacae]HDS7756937.1 hypothetical protein [Enterobacter kobei]
MKPSYEELEQKLAESQREFRAADATIENLQMQVEKLAAENARCKFEISRCHQTVDEMFKSRERWMDKEWLSSIWSTSKRLMEETPATDAIMAEVRAQGVEMFADDLLCPDLDSTIREFAAQLRKGVQS